MGSPFSALTAGLLGQRGLGLAQETARQGQQFGQQQSVFANNIFYGTTSVASDATTGTITLDCSGAYAIKPEVASGPETALAWLDRRVEEMRVKL